MQLNKSFFSPQLRGMKSPVSAANQDKTLGQTSHSVGKYKFPSSAPQRCRRASEQQHRKSKTTEGHQAPAHIQDQGHSWKQRCPCPPGDPGQNSYSQVTVRTNPAWSGSGVTQHRSKLSLAR